MTLVYVCLGLLWILVLGLSAVVFALARQIGVLHERIAPAGALMTGGPAVGTQSPRILARRLDGSQMAVGDPLPAGQSQLLLFISSDCPICKKVIPLAKSVARSEGLDLVFVGDAAPAEQQKLVAAMQLQEFPFLNGPEVGTTYQIGRLPYGVLLDDQGRIAAKGLVNTREHLESLVVSKLTGIPSAQAYVKRVMGSDIS
jgi:methylamine dehydrogenase accessory protein MauD